MNDMEEKSGRIKQVQYAPGLFDEFKAEKQIDLWNGFPELMWGLGYEMDACSSFEEYCEKSDLKTKQVHNTRDKRRNTLYMLEHAGRQIVGNFLFSEWRYFTHWAMEYDGYEYDYLCRIIDILESKYVKEA